MRTNHFLTDPERSLVRTSSPLYRGTDSTKRTGSRQTNHIYISDVDMITIFEIFWIFWALNSNVILDEKLCYEKTTVSHTYELIFRTKIQKYCRYLLVFNDFSIVFWVYRLVLYVFFLMIALIAETISRPS